jgi:hypothetical protein
VAIQLVLWSWLAKFACVVKASDWLVREERFKAGKSTRIRVLVEFCIRKDLDLPFVNTHDLQHSSLCYSSYRVFFKVVAVGMVYI